VFEIVQKSSKRLLEIKTLVSANIMGFDKLFIDGGRSFMYIIKSKDPRIDPVLLSPSLRKNFECH
jgi:hypothetical protein